MSKLLAQVRQTICDKKLFCREANILVAVSGGVDSMVLLHVLHRLAPEFGWRLVVAHFNHQLRGASSEADEQLVRKTAARSGLKFVAGRGDIRRRQRQAKLSLEMAARKLRHEFLAKAAAHLDTPTVALAHHADDQVELFFLRLLRGSASGGLSGMKWTSPSPGDPRIQLVRPLLNQSKADLLGYAEQEGVCFREDATNACLDLQRNRIRHELLPLLTKKYQPALTKTVLRLMEILAADADFIRDFSRQWLAKARRPAFAKLPVAVQRQCVREQLLQLGVEPDFELIEQLRLCTGQIITVSPRLRIFRNEQGVIRTNASETKAFNPQERSIDLSAGIGRVTFDGLELSWQIRACKGTSAFANRRNTIGEFFDADRVGRAVTLRHWRPGDRFQPIGMRVPVKLQDLFTNQKISRARRHALVVAQTSNGEIFWVEGLRMSEPFKLEHQTARQLQWQWQRPIS